MHSLKDLLTRNWFAKLFSIALATMLWLTISSQADSEIGIVIPLEYRNIPSQLEIIDDTANTVEVRLRGRATLIREVGPPDVSATVDLTGLQAGDKIVQLTAHNVRAPFGIEVVRLNPSQVRLNLDRTIIKTIPVIVQLEEAPPPGFEVRDSKASPAVVEVQGPEAKVQPMESIPTSPVSVTGRKENFTTTVDLDLPDPMIRLQNLSPVEVRITISERGSRQ